MKRFLSLIATVATILTSVPLAGIPTAQAGGSLWNWTDISAQLTERQNRPIWAMAYGDDAWFYTDGQNLWNGGQAYRYDGTTQVNITSDIRNAGLDRVDDIVSDGSDTVVFLQDVVRLDNGFRIAVNKNGTYYNVTDIVRGMLNSDEGVSQIVGRNGTWRIVTTKGRLFGWNGNTNAPFEITLPSEARNIISNERNKTTFKDHIVYQPKNHSAVKPLDIQPVNGSEWLVRVGYDERQICDGTCRTTWTHAWYRLSSGGTFTNVTSALPNDRVHAAMLGSDGTNVLIISTGTNASLTRYNGNSVTKISAPSDLWPATAVAWDGTAWVIVESNKQMLRVTNEEARLIGEARDYFVTGASNGNGRTLLGGAVSVLGNPDPTNPLTAKLVIVDENNLSSATQSTTSNNQMTDAASGIRSWEWLEPNKTTLNDGEQTTYSVGAWDGQGIKQIAIYAANGELKRTCNFGTQSGNVECSFTIYNSGFAKSSTIFVQAKITDGENHTAWTTGRSIWNAGTSSSSNTSSQTSSSDTRTWTWVEPNVSIINDGEHAVYHVGAWDGQGIKNIRIYVNGNQRQICSMNNATGNRECSLTIYASNYSRGTTLDLNARIEDANGAIAWTDTTHITRSGEYNTNTNTNTNSNGTVSAWSWFEKTESLKRGESVVFHSQAWAEKGLDRMTVYVNGVAKRTCDFSTAYGNRDCDFTISANNYSADTTLTANVKAVDMNGNTAWSDTKSIWLAKVDSSSNTPSSESKVSVWDWMEPNQTSVETDDIVKYHAGSWAEAGVKSVTMYVNDSAAYTCNYVKGQNNNDCWVQIEGRRFSVGTTVNVKALIRDRNGKETWTNGKTITVVRDSGAKSESGNSNGWITVSSNRDDGFTSGQAITISAQGGDADGVNRIEIYANGTLAKTCMKTTSCSTYLYPRMNDKTFSYMAKIVDTYGDFSATPYTQIAQK